ncbi:MAG: hypothetical protein WBG46_09015 [Nonlabens sp.]
MFNVTAYIIYITFVSTVILAVGHYLYRSGEVLVAKAFINDASLGLTINKLLLIGFYLLNLGAAVLVVAIWPDLENSVQLLSSLFYFISRLLLVLGAMHYINVFTIQILTRKHLNI